MKNLNAMLLADFYKISHKGLYPANTEVIYSTWTARTSRLNNVTKVVSFGQQAFIKNYLLGFFQENFFDKSKVEVVTDYARVLKHTLGVTNPETGHIEALHDLGYLPLSIKALAEGTLVPLRVPMMTIENTLPEFFWLTNYIETLASAELWQAATSATLAYEYRKILNDAAMKTVGDTGFVGFQGHDFSMRGMSSLQSAVTSGMGHLTSFVGTDTIPAIQGAEAVYNANIETELVGTSVPASEHSIQSSYANDTEYFKESMAAYPTGILSIVSDGFDFWNVIGNVLPSLKSEIMARNGKLVIRPDSGDPANIICGDPNGKTELERKGAVEALWDIFGGTETEKGYKLLDSHIGLIYGDAITLSRAKDITDRLAAKGFASINVVFGIGSYTYQYNTRDTFGFALKSTYAVINGDEKQIFKDPKTDDGVKKSLKGRVIVLKDASGQLIAKDGLLAADDTTGDQLVEIFRDGKLLVETSLSEIRARLANA